MRCFNHMKRIRITSKVLEATVEERNEMRSDNVNVKIKIKLSPSNSIRIYSMNY